MHAVTFDSFGGPEVLRLAEVPTPEPGPGEVLVRVAASGVNRADLMQREGHYPPPRGASDILGLEVSGVIDAVGDGVDDWRPGDECVALLSGGGYAEYVVAPAGQLVVPPRGIDLVTASGLIEVAATVTSNLSLVGLGAGETFLVHGGTGGIGTFAIQYATGLGARVFATAGSAPKRALCRELGAADAFDYHGDWVAALREATDGRGADVILDVMGASYLPSNLDALALDGRLVVIGLQGGRTGTLDLAKLLAKRASVTATGLRGRPREQKASICAEVVRSVWPLIESGRIKPATETRFDATDAADAHRRLASGSAVGKLILTW